MFTSITDFEREQRGVSRLPDSPNIPSAELKEAFDSLGNLSIDAFNNHIVEISAETGADNIGAQAPEGIAAAPRIQPILNAIVANMQASQHTHANKTVLDNIYAYIYPLGTIYSTTNSSFSPDEAFGGTWEAYSWTGDTSGLSHFVRIA